MSLADRASAMLAGAFVAAFTLPASAEQDTLPDLVEKLEVWLDDNSPWERRSAPPAIRVLPPRLAAQQYGSAGSIGRELRAFYDDRTGTITLVSLWSIWDLSDQSVLLHELVHHRQAPHHWYCPDAQELPAYKLQARWADAHGVEVPVDWVAAVLASGCTRRDIHPN